MEARPGLGEAGASRSSGAARACCAPDTPCLLHNSRDSHCALTSSPACYRHLKGAIGRSKVAQQLCWPLSPPSFTQTKYCVAEADALSSVVPGLAAVLKMLPIPFKETTKVDLIAPFTKYIATRYSKVRSDTAAACTVVSLHREGHFLPEATCLAA